MKFETALEDILSYLRSQEDEYFLVRNTTKEAALADTSRLDLCAREHRKWAERIGIDRERSCKEACDNYPGIVASIPAREGKLLRNHEDGICPLCGKEIDYVGAYEHDDDGATLDWQCPFCGASGKAGYNFVFDQHYCIWDGNGNAVE